MPLESLLKLLFAAKLPLAAAAFGLTLNISGDNVIARNIGASAVYLGLGSAATIVSRKNTQLAEIRQLEARHARESAALKSSVETAIKDNAIAQQAVRQRENALSQLRSELAQLGTAITEVKTERDRLKAEVLKMSDGMNRMSASLSVCDSDKSELAGKLHDLELERTQLIAELYETAVEEVAIAQNIASLEKQFKNDVDYQLTQKKKLKSAVTKARADFHTQLADAEATIADREDRIAQLEKDLADKTQLAQSMIGELTSDANGKFTQFSGQAGAQNELINGLRVQIDELRKSNKALTHRRFDTVGTDNIMGNRLIDALAKHGSIYGAFHHEREGHNGRLKIWLTMIDAPLKRAHDALEDIEAEMSLYAKPTVRVDRGMHLFTLATEREYEVKKTYSDNLNRLEKDFDLMNHIRLVGGTGSGKSTFLDNLIWLGKLLWPTANMSLLDPKAPYTKWQGGLTPDFKNLECVEAIQNISAELQSRFADANKIADEFGNDSPEFESYVNELPYKLFVLDEAQYLYRIARAEDNKEKPKGNRANTVRDSLLDCLGVGRALNVKGYFITQSAKCSKLNMNEDDFDNATSIFLNAAIATALEGELKGAFADSRLDKVMAEYESRKASGQKYIGLVAHADSNKLYLFQPPQPGYFHGRVLTAKAAPDLDTGKKVQNAETKSQKEAQVGTNEGTDEGLHLVVPTLDPPLIHPSILTEGKAACPTCGTFSTTIRDGKINTLGKVKFACKNSDCKKQMFSAVPII